MMRRMRRAVVLMLVAAGAVASAEGRGVQAVPSERPTAAQPAADATPEAQVTPRLERFVDRVWVVESGAGVPDGTRYIFLSDNVLVISASGKPPTTGTWAEGAEGLVITTGGRSQDVAVIEQAPERFRIRIGVAGRARTITFAPAIPPPAPAPALTSTAVPEGAPAGQVPAAPATPVGLPYQCGADRVRVAFEGDTAYVTLPDDTVAVLREVKTAETSASRRLYTDGQLRVVEDTSEAYTRVLFARPGFRPRPCTSTR
jgi:hypothetical protein